MESNGIHKGHRQRMHRKFECYGDRPFDTYELLEMLLYNVIPYKDTNPVSKKLLSRFSSLDGVLSASREELEEVEGVGSAVSDFIVKLSEFCSFMGRVPMTERPRLDDYRKAGEYVAELLGEESDNCVVMLLLNNRLDLIDATVVYRKPYESGGVRPDVFLEHAIRSRASVVMTAHTTPGCALFPTVGTNETNKLITEALAVAGVIHLEHYVVSSHRYIGTFGKNKYCVGQSAEIEKFLKSREGV